MQLGKLGVWAPMDALTAAEGAEFATTGRRLGIFRAVAAGKPRPQRAGAFVLAARQYAEPDRRARHRQHLRPRPDGDGERPARARRAVRRPVSARDRRLARADGRGAARPHLRQAGRDDARLSDGDGAGALCRAGAAGKAADDPRRARAAHAGAVGRARRRRAPLQRPARAHRRGAPHPRARQAAVPGGLGAARNRPREGPLGRAARRWRRICSSTITSTTGGGSVSATTRWRAAAPTALSTPMSPGATEEAIRKRIQEHWDAGADHVCIQSIHPDGSRRPDEKVLALLAPGGA